jgi:hypothetical protein
MGLREPGDCHAASSPWLPESRNRDPRLTPTSALETTDPYFLKNSSYKCVGVAQLWAGDGTPRADAARRPSAAEARSTQHPCHACRASCPMYQLTAQL